MLELWRQKGDEMLKDDLVERYGITMSVVDMAEVLHVRTQSIYNKISKNDFDIPVFKIGRKVLAYTKDVSDYLDNVRIVAKGIH